MGLFPDLEDDGQGQRGGGRATRRCGPSAARDGLRVGAVRLQDAERRAQLGYQGQDPRRVTLLPGEAEGAGQGNAIEQLVDVGHNGDGLEAARGLQLELGGPSNSGAQCRTARDRRVPMAGPGCLPRPGSERASVKSKREKVPTRATARSPPWGFGKQHKRTRSSERGSAAEVRTLFKRRKRAAAVPKLL